MNREGAIIRLMDPDQQALALLLDLLQADREARIVRAATSRDLARLSPGHADVHRRAVVLCDRAAAVLEDLRRRVDVGGTDERSA